MKIIKNIIGRVYALYAILLFVVSVLIVVLCVSICYLVKDDYRRTKMVLHIYRVWMAVFMPGIFCPVRKKGAQHFAHGKNYIVVVNHNSFMDVLAITPNVPAPNKTLAKKEMASIPLFGLIYKSGSILVDRKDKNSRRQSFDQMKKVLRAGMHLILYPEGTRNKTSEPLKPFHDGAFSLAIDTGTPIIPALIFNTRSVMPPGKIFYGWPHTIRIHFLEPVPVENYTLKEEKIFKEKIFQLMKEYYVDNC